MVIIGYLVFLVVCVALMIAFYLKIYSMAENKNVLTFVREGEVVPVEKGGDLHKFLYAVDGWVLLEEYEGVKWVFVKESELPPDLKKHIGFMQGVFGLHVIGPPKYYSVPQWEFEWNKWAPEKDDPTTNTVVHKKDKIRALKFQFPYAMKITDVEIQGQLKVDFYLVVTLRTLRPYVSLYMTGGKWLDQVTAYVEAATKDYMGGYDLDSIRDMKSQPGQDSAFVEAIKKLNTADLGNNYETLVELTGQCIIDVRFVGFELQGSEAEKKAATALAVAQMNAKASVATAEGEARSRKIAAEAENEYLASTVAAIAELGPDAVEAYKWHQVGGKDSKVQTLVEKGAISVNLGQK